MIQFLAQTACFFNLSHCCSTRPRLNSQRYSLCDDGSNRDFSSAFCVPLLFVSLLIWLILIAVLVRKIDLKVELCIHFQEMFVNRNNRALIMNRKTSWWCSRCDWWRPTPRETQYQFRVQNSFSTTRANFHSWPPWKSSYPGLFWCIPGAIFLNVHFCKFYHYIGWYLKHYCFKHLRSSLQQWTFIILMILFEFQELNKNSKCTKLQINAQVNSVTIYLYFR